MKKYIVGAFIVLIILVMALGNSVVKQRAIVKRQSENIEVLNARAFNDSTKAARKLRLTQQEFNEYIKFSENEVGDLLKELGIKSKQLESYKGISSNTNIHVITETRDSVIYRVDTLIKVKAINWKDSWNSVQGYVINDTLDIRIEVSDTLHLIKYWKRNIPWFPLSRKIEKFQISNENPNVSYYLSENVEIIKE